MKTANLLAALRHGRPPEIAAARTLEIGLSGGLDSVVLLFLMKRLCAEWGVALSAVHVHHGLQTAADDWAAFCAELCREWQIPLRIERVEVRAAGQGVEAAARQARYAAFARSKADALVSAHHADDQSETFFLAALRGGGLHALSAMPALRRLNAAAFQSGGGQEPNGNGAAVRAFSDGANGQDLWLWRPLLPFSRQDLADVAAENGLPFIEDPMNAAPELLRAWLRHHGLPFLRGRVPMLDKHVGSSIALLQDELAVLQEIAEEDCRFVEESGFFDVQRWRTLSLARRRPLLQRWMQRQGLGTANRAQLQNMVQTLDGLGGAAAHWRLPQGELHAYQNRLFALPQGWQAAFSDGLLQADGGPVCLNALLGQGWQLAEAAGGLPRETAERAVVRRVHADDVLAMKTGRKNVMKLLQEYRVAPFARALWPVLDDGAGNCIAAAGIRVADPWQTEGGVLPVCCRIQPFAIGRG